MALDAINRTLPSRWPLVLTSRNAAWRTALAPPDDATAAVRLNGATAIALRALDAEQAAGYLRRDAGGEHSPAAARWETVAAHLGTDSPLGQALSTPLGLFLARTIYNPRPQTTRAEPVPHPSELCDAARFPDRTAVDTHLFAAFLPAVYRSDSPRPPRWSAGQAQRTLIFLAHFLQTHQGGSPDLAWWELPRAVPTRVYRLTAGLTAGLTLGLMDGLTAGIAVGLAVGPASGSAAGLEAGKVHAPDTRLHWPPRKIVVGGVLGLAVALAAGLTLGVAAGLTVGAALTIESAIEAETADLTVNTAPDVLLISDRRTFTASGLAGWLVYGLPFGLTLALALGLEFGIATGIATGLGDAAWPHFVMAVAYLSVRHKIPRDLMAFLQNAHERGVLRPTGVPVPAPRPAAPPRTTAARPRPGRVPSHGAGAERGEPRFVGQLVDDHPAGAGDGALAQRHQCPAALPSPRAPPHTSAHRTWPLLTEADQS